jgi:hypothetical protein
MVHRFAAVVVLVASLPAIAADPQAGTEVDCPTPTAVPDGRATLSSRGLLTNLEGFLAQRNIDINRLTADAMVRVIIDWYRFSPADWTDGAAASDNLIYRYGGWSEGCATGFKLSLLRRVGDPGATAGITLMFEPSGRAELAPFTAVASNRKDVEVLLEAIQSSPAFRQLGKTTPMAVMLESGGLR